MRNHLAKSVLLGHFCINDDKSISGQSVLIGHFTKHKKTALEHQSVLLGHFLIILGAHDA